VYQLVEAKELILAYRTSALMSRLIRSRLEATIAAGQTLIQQLCTPSAQAHLDALYVRVLFTCTNGNEKSSGQILGAPIVLAEPITPALLSALLRLPAQQVASQLQAFVDARLLTTDNPLDLIIESTAIRVCHESLRHFVVNPLRCRSTHFLIDPAKIHGLILHRCLCLLNTYLRQNICDIRNPDLANVEIPDLPARIARCLPDAVRYACLAWPVHLAACGSITESVSAELLDFSRSHLLHWLEVLSLLGELSSVGKHRVKLMTWCQVSNSLGSQEQCLIEIDRIIPRICQQCERYHYS
jgi:hypothetical protein